MKHAAIGAMCLAFWSSACGGEGTPAKLPPPPPPGSVTPPAGSEPSVQAVDRSKLPAPAPPPAWALPKPEIFSLTNGMRVYFMKQGPTPLVSLVLVFARGSATDPKGKSGLSALTADMLDEGAGGKGTLEINEELQRLGTEYGASVDVDSVMLSMNTIAESFAPSVAILSDIVRKPAFDAKEFTRRKDQRIADALAAESEPSSARAIVMKKALFGDGYAGDVPTGTRSTLKNIGFGDVKAQYKALIAAEGAAFVVVGGIDGGSVKQALEKSFGDYQGKAGAKSAPVSSAKPAKGIYFIDYPGTTQSALSIARRAPGEGTPEYFPGLVFSRILGESFTSRLNLNLREDKGYTYGANSGYRRWKDVGYFALNAGVKRETTRASIDESLKELRDICASRPVSAKERDEAVGGLLLGFPGRFERTGDVASQLAALPLYARPDDWLEKWPDHVKAVSGDNVGEIAKQYCNTDDYVIVVAGDRKLVEPTLEGLGEKISFYDAQGNRAGK